MSTLLYITANPKETESSFGLSTGKAFLQTYENMNPEGKVIHLDVYRDDIPLIDEEVLGAWESLSKGKSFEELSAGQQNKLSRMEELVNQFIEADSYVFVTPMWNLGFPPMFKAYLDNIMIAGKTFKYTEEGPVGLMKNKKALHIQASGGVYSEGPAQSLDFASGHLQAALNFIGVEDAETIHVEGMAADPGKAEEILKESVQNAEDAAARFVKHAVRS
ncbi:FMN-dependent NADH-azoreductase [Bacillus marinisedimentorum]|uniref:FMN-dependent NADH-azoreductase n=1 Tax=Bacillus marinisedimentorum TaxID=1821260 RepID=UPI000872237B|nr:NAD(P)H-dependent oxidoreductase [Bacillus marinisedimentorum]